MLPRLVLCVRRLVELPCVLPTSGVDTEPMGQRARCQKQPLQFIPPELAAGNDASGGKKHRRRHTVALQQRQCRRERVGVAVIEGHDDGGVRSRAVAHDVFERLGCDACAQFLQLFGEQRRRHRERPWVAGHVRDPVIAENQQTCIRSQRRQCVAV
jgi:hypothetical protein